MTAMATMEDLDAFALALPETTKRESADGRPEYLVRDKRFCSHREDRKDAVDPATGERLQDVLMFSVADLDVKEHLLTSNTAVFFTTDHFDGYAAVLVRIANLHLLPRDDLDDLVVEAWLAKAPKRVAKAWLAEQSDT